ncbi:MAG: GntR family transcriptional regulator [Candidatus Cellulosilyticum pullistercoris]|uniref:GntR family transcriptional regulator n=1 Tax=Candidatus Cellulosilyticum pullistercoris TaxID=2838521 RepID=A0A9E2KBJ7_9FIRM|nr:GntR family transcriptional regulator [Candidatus Cellulosilyticum pullistercoris]
MRIELDFSSEKPIYEQLYESIIKAMATSELKANESLPSVRALAEEIGINLHTVNKAYNLLKDEGYITVDRRKGAIVNKLPINSSQIHQNTLMDALSILTAKAHLMGMDEAEFSKLCHKYFLAYKEDLL